MYKQIMAQLSTLSTQLPQVSGQRQHPAFAYVVSRVASTHGHHEDLMVSWQLCGGSCWSCMQWSYLVSCTQPSISAADVQQVENHAWDLAALKSFVSSRF